MPGEIPRKSERRVVARACPCRLPATAQFTNSIWRLRPGLSTKGSEGNLFGTFSRPPNPPARLRCWLREHAKSSSACVVKFIQLGAGPAGPGALSQTNTTPIAMTLWKYSKGWIETPAQAGTGDATNHYGNDWMLLKPRLTSKASASNRGAVPL